jgi:hypothetical protein
LICGQSISATNASPSYHAASRFWEVGAFVERVR